MSHPGTTPEIDDDAPHLAAEYIYLFIAIVTSILSLTAWLIGLSIPSSTRAADVLQGVFELLRVAAVLAGCGWLVRSAEAHVSRLMQRRAADADEARKEGYAAGYVDGVARREPSDVGFGALRPIH